MISKFIATATLAVALCVGVAAQAEACFQASGGGDGCIAVEICSYNANGTGGYYIAHYVDYCRY